MYEVFYWGGENCNEKYDGPLLDNYNWGNIPCTLLSVKHDTILNIKMEIY